MPEKEFPIDKFREVASWMGEVDRRLNNLEALVQQLGTRADYQSERLTDLEKYVASLKVVMKKEAEL